MRPDGRPLVEDSVSRDRPGVGTAFRSLRCSTLAQRGLRLNPRFPPPDGLPRRSPPSDTATPQDQLPVFVAGLALRVYDTGRVRRNTAPPPGALSAVTVPPWASATCLTIARPSPEPGKPRAPAAR